MNRRSALTSVASLAALGALAGSRARASDATKTPGGEAHEHAASTIPSLPPVGTLPPLAANHAAEVHATLLQQAEQWTAGDLGAFCSHYADSCMFFTPSGLTVGRHEVFSQYRKKYPAREQMGALTIDIIDLKASEQLASAALRWSLTWANRSGAERMSRGHSVLTLERTPTGVWRIIYDASM